MPMSLEAMKNPDQGLVLQSRPAGQREDKTLTSQAAGLDWHVVPLDQLKVVEGVYRKAQLTSANELVPGDEIQFPFLDDQSRASRPSNTGSNPVNLATANGFGPATFSADVTHSVIFLSGTGHHLAGYVLDSSPNADGRASLLLSGVPRPKLDYALIDISENGDRFDAAVTEAKRGVA